LEDLGIAGKLFLPVALITSIMLIPRPEPDTIVIELSDWPVMPAANILLENPVLTLPEQSSIIVDVKPSIPVVTEKVVHVPGPTTTVFQDREVIVERIVEVRTCLDFDALPSWDLARAVSMARPGESWSLSGDYYPGLNWLDSTPKPSEGQIIAGWLKALEAECD